MCEPARKTHALWYPTFSTPNRFFHQMRVSTWRSSLRLPPHSPHEREQGKLARDWPQNLFHTIHYFSIRYILPYGTHKTSITFTTLYSYAALVDKLFHTLANPFYCLLSNEFFIGKLLHLTQNANTIKKQKSILFY